jgi:hypothetical protein
LAADRPPRRLEVSDRALGTAAVALLLVLALTLVGGWLALREPRMDPVPLPSVAQA